MIEMQQVFARFAETYLTTHPCHSEGTKAAKAIVNCRTAALGGHVDQCDACDEVKVSYNSCRNRNCPKCGNVKKEQWILDRTSELLPVPYFHVVCTVPHQLNPVFLAHPALMNSLFFRAASGTLTQLALDPKFLGAQIGVTMVLHTWGQNLSFHPHVHCIVPGGGLSADGRSFIRSRKKFFLPVKVLSAVFRGKLLALVKRAFVDRKLTFAGCSDPLAEEEAFMALLTTLYALDWVVYCKKPFKSPYHVVKYLSRYTHKTAISNNRLVSMRGIRYLSLPRLQRQRKGQADDTRCDGVPAPIYATCAPCRFSAHPLLRFSQQLPSTKETATMHAIDPHASEAQGETHRQGVDPEVDGQGYFPMSLWGELVSDIHAGTRFSLMRYHWNRYVMREPRRGGGSYVFVLKRPVYEWLMSVHFS